MKSNLEAKVIILVLLLVSLTCSAWGKSVTLSWDASPSSVSGYKIHYGINSSATPLDDGGPIDVGNVLTYTVAGLSDSDDHYFAVTAYDSSGNESTYSNIVHSPPVSSNVAPVLSSVGDKSILEGAILSFTISASDADGDQLTFSATGLPSGAGLNSSTGAFSWIPASNQAGQYSVTFSVSDGAASDSETIQITVADVAENRAPVLASIGNKAVDEGETQYIPVSATDADGDTLIYSATGLPQGASINGTTGMFSWPTTYDQAGSYSITFSVSDGSLSDSEQVTINVVDVNRAPVLTTIGEKSIGEGSQLTFTISGSDADGDALTYSASDLPTGAAFNVSTRQFSWTPSYEQAGSYTVTFSVSDGSLTDSEQVAISVSSSNRAPVLNSIGTKSVGEGSQLTFTISGSDADGDALTYSASDLPTGAAFNVSTRQFSWTPSYEQAGSYAVTFSVSDGSLTDSEQVAISVGSSNRAPVLNSIGTKSVGEGSQLTFTISGSDADSDALTYSASDLPTGAAFNVSTRQFSWLPDYQESENTRIYAVTFAVSDGLAQDDEIVTINVTNVNRAPILSAIGPQSFTEGDSVNLTLLASDPDNNDLTYSATNLPEGAVFTPSTRSFSWIPGTDQSGTYTVTFAVSDGDLTDSEAVTMTVANGNEAPVLAAIGSQSVNEGDLLEFVVSAADANGDDLIFSVSGLPEGASFNGSNRTFSWTPNYSQAGSFTVDFRVSDGSLVDAESVQFSVVDMNRAPQISGSPATSVMATTSYSFTPAASDPDGDTVSFSVENAPSWSTFNSTNGTLSGTPGESQAGVFANIRISVNDGHATASLGPFSIEVTAYVPLDSDGDGVYDHLDAFPNDPNESIDTDGDSIGNNSDTDDDNDGVADIRDGFPLDAAKQGWIINASAGTGGYISPEGETSVLFGGSQRFELTPMSGYYVNDLLIDSVSVGLVGEYTFDNVSQHHTLEAVFAPIPNGLSYNPLSSGLVGVDRVDGGDDSNNFVDGKPKQDVDYQFRVTLRDSVSADQREVYLVLNSYKYAMSLVDGALATGAEYIYTTRLGPAYAQQFHFVATDDLGHEQWRYPDSGELNGPVVELMNGRNIIGLAADINAHALDSGEAFDMKTVYRWLPDSGPNGSFKLVDSGAPVSSAEGYVLKKASGGTLLECCPYGDIAEETYEFGVQAGWNLISNPYGGNVALADFKVKRGDDAALSWLDAADNRLVVDVIYSYLGDDWGGDNEFSSASGDNPAILIPWIGYWIYVNPSDQPVSVLITKPLQ